MTERSKDTTDLFQSTFDPAKRKRLGQYFTGQRLARLLALLANAHLARSIIDPMCGSGDMLAATRTIAPAAELFGVEIDSEVYRHCISRFQDSNSVHPHIKHGSAFDETIIAQLPHHSFDLVITNPPYVRYQSLSNRVQNETIPSLTEVRAGPSRIVDRLESMDASTREVFKVPIDGYSGLSDLAVPSWLLCAMLTRVGGTLAMIVPASWLSRDYSQVIHYLLLKLFRIRWVVEDAHSVWFNNALVNTTLLVAERIPIVDNPRNYWGEQSYSHVIVSSQAMDQRSVVGAIFPDEDDPDTAYVDSLRAFEEGNDSSNVKFTSITRHSLKQKCKNLFISARNSGWLNILEGPSGTLSQDVLPTGKQSLAVLPQRLKDLLPVNHQMPFTNLEKVGLQVGQGLRTGANRFFYVEAKETKAFNTIISVDEIFGIPPFEIDNKCLRRVLRKQSEVSGHFELEPSVLTGRVLVLDRHFLPEDFDELPYQGNLSIVDTQQHYVMDASLALYVRTAATTNIGSVEEPRYVPELSAVRTNQARADGKSGGRAPRYWYMLPAFAPRHIPDLFTARINHLHPLVMKNSSEKILIDANFSTFWVQRPAATDVYGFLALLNSSWCVAAMELMGTVMGGGALKLEAGQLRHIPIPVLSPKVWKRLSDLGNQLVVGDNPGLHIDHIDNIIATELCSDNDQAEEFNVKLKSLNNMLLKIRTRNRL